MGFRKWIVALVAGLLIDKVVNHTVIVFSGKQGVGKTTWILNIVRPAATGIFIFRYHQPGQQRHINTVVRVHVN